MDFRQISPNLQANSLSSALPTLVENKELASLLDQHSLGAIIEWKIARFLDQLGTYYPPELYDVILQEAEKPLLNQILRRTGGNQVHAAKILGINRNTLRKKMKQYTL